MSFSAKQFIRIALIAALSVVIIFYIFAKGVNIEVLPIEASSNASLTLQDGFGISLSNRFIFFPGKKRILVQSPGFYENEITVEVDSSSNTYTVELKKLPGKVKLSFSPSISGDVYIDEKLIKPVENFFIVEAGKHKLEVRHPLYLPYISMIEVVGMNKEQNLSLVLKPNWAVIGFSSRPINAQVFMAGMYLGETPFKGDIVSGLHEITYKKEGYEDLLTLERIEVGKGRDLATAELNLLPASVSLVSKQERVKVFVNDTFKGFTPIKISLKPNKNHKLLLDLEGYSPSERLVNLPANEQSKILIDLKPLFGKVSIVSNPLSTIYLDGRILGKSPYEGSLQALPQKLVIKRTGYRTYSTNIKPSDEFETNVSVTLITEEQARFVESPKEYMTQGNNKMILLQPGVIQMGAIRSQAGQRANETMRKVRLTKPFYLSVHEVTNSQFLSYKQTDSQNNRIDRDNLPVTNISWNEAALYCNWLSRKEGLSLFYKVKNGRVAGFILKSEGYRMPTESEWTWSARSTDSKKSPNLVFPWGNKMPLIKGSGNYADESYKGSSSYIPNYRDGFPERSPVGSFKANKRGIYDMGGNVSEFVNDFYSIMNNSDKTYIDLTGPARGRGHVVKGSNWGSSNLTELRYSYRDESSQGDNETGFRIARWLIGKSDENN